MATTSTEIKANSAELMAILKTSQCQLNTMYTGITEASAASRPIATYPFFKIGVLTKNSPSMARIFIETTLKDVINSTHKDVSMILHYNRTKDNTVDFKVEYCSDASIEMLLGYDKDGYLYLNRNIKVKDEAPVVKDNVTIKSRYCIDGDICMQVQCSTITSDTLFEFLGVDGIFVKGTDITEIASSGSTAVYVTNAYKGTVQEIVNRGDAVILTGDLSSLTLFPISIREGVNNVNLIFAPDCSINASIACLINEIDSKVLSLRVINSPAQVFNVNTAANVQFTALEITNCASIGTLTSTGTIGITGTNISIDKTPLAGGNASEFKFASIAKLNFNGLNIDRLSSLKLTENPAVVDGKGTVYAEITPVTSKNVYMNASVFPNTAGIDELRFQPTAADITIVGNIGRINCRYFGFNNTGTGKYSISLLTIDAMCVNTSEAYWNDNIKKYDIKLNTSRNLDGVSVDEYTINSRNISLNSAKKPMWNDAESIIKLNTPGYKETSQPITNASFTKLVEGGHISIDGEGEKYTLTDALINITGAATCPQTIVISDAIFDLGAAQYLIKLDVNPVILNTQIILRNVKIFATGLKSLVFLPGSKQIGTIILDNVKINNIDAGLVVLGSVTNAIIRNSTVVSTNYARLFDNTVDNLSINKLTMEIKTAIPTSTETVDPIVKMTNGNIAVSNFTYSIKSDVNQTTKGTIFDLTGTSGSITNVKVKSGRIKHVVSENSTPANTVPFVNIDRVSITGASTIDSAVYAKFDKNVKVSGVSFSDDVAITTVLSTGDNTANSLSESRITTLAEMNVNDRPNNNNYLSGNPPASNTYYGKVLGDEKTVDINNGKITLRKATDAFNVYGTVTVEAVDIDQELAPNDKSFVEAVYTVEPVPDSSTYKFKTSGTQSMLKIEKPVPNISNIVDTAGAKATRPIIDVAYGVINDDDNSGKVNTDKVSKDARVVLDADMSTTGKIVVADPTDIAAGKTSIYGGKQLLKRSVGTKHEVIKLAYDEIAAYTNTNNAGAGIADTSATVKTFSLKRAGKSEFNQGVKLSLDSRPPADNAAGAADDNVLETLGKTLLKAATIGDTAGQALEIVGSVKTTGDTATTGATTLTGTLGVTGKTTLADTTINKLEVTTTTLLKDKTTLHNGMEITAVGATVTGKTVLKQTAGVNDTTLDVTGSSDIKGTSTFTGKTVLKQKAGVTDDTTLDVTGSSDIKGTSTFTGKTVLAQPKNVAENALEVSGQSSITGNSTFAGVTKLTQLAEDITKNSLEVIGTTTADGNVKVAGETSLIAKNKKNEPTVPSEDTVALRITGDTKAKGATTLTGTLGVTAKTSLVETAITTAPTATALTVTGNTDLNNNLEVDGKTKLNDDLTVTKGETSLTAKTPVGAGTTLALRIAGDTEATGNNKVKGETSLIAKNKITPENTAITPEDSVALNIIGDTKAKGATTLTGTLGVTDKTNLVDTAITTAPTATALTVTGKTKLNNELDVVKATTLNDTLTVKKKSNLVETAITIANTANTALTVTGNTVLENKLNVKDAADLDSTLNVDGKSTLDVTEITVAGDTATALTVTGGETSLTAKTPTGTNKTVALKIVGGTAATGDVGVTGNTVLMGTLGVTAKTSLVETAITTSPASTALTVTGNTDLNNDLNVDGKSTLEVTDITIANTASTALTVTGNTELKNKLTVTKETTLSDTLTVNKKSNLVETAITTAPTATALTVTGNTDLNNDLNVDGKSTLDVTDITITDANTPGALTVTGGETSLTAKTPTGTNKTVALKISGDTKAIGDVNVTGATDLDSTLNVDGATTLKNTLTVTGATDLDSTLNVDGATALKSTLTVYEKTTLKNGIDVNCNATVAGKTSLTAAAPINNVKTLALEITGDTKATGATALDGTLNVTGITTVTTLDGVADNSITIAAPTVFTDTTTLSVNTDAATKAETVKDASVLYDGDVGMKANLRVDKNINTKKLYAEDIFVSGTSSTVNTKTLNVTGNTSLARTAITTAPTATALTVTGNTVLENKLTVNGVTMLMGDVCNADTTAITVTSPTNFTNNKKLVVDDKGIITDASVCYTGDVGMKSDLKVANAITAKTLNVQDIFVSGTTGTVNTETLTVKDSVIVTRIGATGALKENEYSGIVSKKYDGEYDGGLIFDKNGTGYLGDVKYNETTKTITKADTTPAMPIAVRDESVSMTDKGVVKWNETGSKLITAGITINDDSKGITVLEPTGDRILKLQKKDKNGTYTYIMLTEEGLNTSGEITSGVLKTTQVVIPTAGVPAVDVNDMIVLGEGKITVTKKAINGSILKTVEMGNSGFIATTNRDTSVPTSVDKKVTIDEGNVTLTGALTAGSVSGSTVKVGTVNANGTTTAGSITVTNGLYAKGTFTANGAMTANGTVSVVKEIDKVVTSGTTDAGSLEVKGLLTANGTFTANAPMSSAGAVSVIIGPIPGGGKSTGTTTAGDVRVPTTLTATALHAYTTFDSLGVVTSNNTTTAGNAVVTGTLTAASFNASENFLSKKQATSNNTTTAGSVKVTGLLTAKAFTSDATAAMTSAGQVSVKTNIDGVAYTGTTDAGSVKVTGLLSANTFTANAGMSSDGAVSVKTNIDGVAYTGATDAGSVKVTGTLNAKKDFTANADYVSTGIATSIGTTTAGMAASGDIPASGGVSVTGTLNAKKDFTADDIFRSYESVTSYGDTTAGSIRVTKSLDANTLTTKSAMLSDGFIFVINRKLPDGPTNGTVIAGSADVTKSLNADMLTTKSAMSSEGNVEVTKNAITNADGTSTTTSGGITAGSLEVTGMITAKTSFTASAGMSSEGAVEVKKNPITPGSATKTSGGITAGSLEVTGKLSVASLSALKAALTSLECTTITGGSGAIEFGSLAVSGGMSVKSFAAANADFTSAGQVSVKIGPIPGAGYSTGATDAGSLVVKGLLTAKAFTSDATTAMTSAGQVSVKTNIDGVAYTGATDAGSVKVTGLLSANTFTADANFRSNGQAIAGTTTAGSVDVAGLLSANTFTAQANFRSNGQATSRGTTTAGGVDVAGLLSANTFTADANFRSNSQATAGTTGAGSVAVTGLLSANTFTAQANMTAAGNVSVNKNSITPGSTDKTTGNVTAGSLDVKGTLTANADLTVTGKLDSSGALVTTAGNLKATTLNAKKVTVNGNVEGGDITAEGFVTGATAVNAGYLALKNGTNNYNTVFSMHNNQINVGQNVYMSGKTIAMYDTNVISINNAGTLSICNDALKIDSSGTLTCRATRAANDFVTGGIDLGKGLCTLTGGPGTIDKGALPAITANDEYTTYTGAADVGLYYDAAVTNGISFKTKRLFYKFGSSSNQWRTDTVDTHALANYYLEISIKAGSSTVVPTVETYVLMEVANNTYGYVRTYDDVVRMAVNSTGDFGQDDIQKIRIYAQTKPSNYMVVIS